MPSPPCSPLPSRTTILSPSPTPTSIRVITPTPPHWTTPVPGSLQETKVDKVHRSISHLVAAEVYKFDSYFGSSKLEEDAKDPQILVRGGVEWQDGEKLKWKQRFHFYFPLPILERRLGTFLGTDEDGNPEDDPNYFDTPSGHTASAGLRYHFNDLPHLKSNINVGAKLNFNSPDVFIRPMAKLEIPSGRFYLEPRQYVFWYSDDGLGEETDFEIDYSAGKRWLLRAETDATYSNTSNGVDFSQGFAVQYVDFLQDDYPHFAVSLEWESSGHTWPSSKFFQHQAWLRIRHHIWRPWLRLEYGPSILWERITADDDEMDFPDYWKNGAPVLFLYVEILFEDLFFKNGEETL